MSRRFAQSKFKSIKLQQLNRDQRNTQMYNIVHIRVGDELCPIVPRLLLA